MSKPKKLPESWDETHRGKETPHHLMDQYAQQLIDAWKRGKREGQPNEPNR